MDRPFGKLTILLLAILSFARLAVAQTTTYVETSGKGPSLTSIACDATSISNSFALSSTTGSATTKSFTLAGNAFTAIAFTTASGVPGLTSWPPNLYALAINNTTANANIQVLDICFDRISSSGSLLTELCRASPNPGLPAPLSTATVRSFGCSFSSSLSTSSTDQLSGILVLQNLASSRQSVTLQFNTSSDTLTVTPGPVINSLSPPSGNAGASVTIAGAHFGSVTGTVTFNGASATISSWSDGTIGTSVPTLASTGNVVVTTSNGSASNGVLFTVLAPAITSMSPASGPAGTSVTISGNHFGASQGSGTVTFNGTTATVSSWSDSSITASVPALTTSGNVVVTATNGEASAGVSFTIPAPSIANVSPDFARVGTSITIVGSNFGSVQGSLKFNGTAAAPSSWNNTQIVAPVPNGATTGPVVVTQAGASNSVNFTVDPPPSITSISPTSGPANTSVTVSGLGFGIPQGTSTIQFNGTAATPFSWSDSTIVASVPVGATTGPIVVSAGGVNSNGATFTVTGAPSISSLSVSSGAPGTAVTINGQNFGATQGSSVVRFNGLPASVSSWSAGAIGVTVPGGVTTGPVTVTVSGQASNGLTFTAITTGTLSGTVSSSTGGSAISGASIQALQNGAVKASATTASNGTYSIANLQSGNYDIQASASGFGTALSNSVAVPAGQTTTANFSLSSPGTISGTVTQSNGVTAIPGASVQYFVGSAAGSTSTTDNNGNYSITGLNAGLYTVEAGASGYVTQSQTASVTGGNSSTASFSLQALGAKPINYVYDELGRLVSVIDSAGDKATYNYDAVGNILSISRQNSSQLSIISFTPRSGTVGTSVTINGTGFSATASQDSVSFNGVSATVTSATTMQINVTVPSSATTGPITVTTPSGTVSSSLSFTVLTGSGAPTVTGFTPNMGTSGTSVAITGTNFDIAANDRVIFNTSYAGGVSSATNSQVNTSVPASTGSGRISVVTPAGTGVSTQDFYIPFGTHVAGDIGYTGRISIGGTQTVTLASSKIALLLFDGIAGQGVSLQFSGSTFSFCLLYLLSPTQVQIATTNCTSSTTLLASTVLPVSGTYVIGIDPSTTAGSVTVGLTADVTGSITPGTPLNATTTAAGQDARYTFTGTAGQQASVNVTNSTYSSCAVVSILKPNGTTLGSSTSFCSGSGFLDSLTLPVSGTYTVLLAPNSTGSATLLLSLFNNVTGTITPGTSLNLTTSYPGQDGLFTFSGTAGQQASVVTTNSTNPNCVTVAILKPDGTSLGSNFFCGASGFLDELTLPSTGTYTVWFDPSGPGTGSATLLLSIFNNVTGTITPGTQLNTTISYPGQDALYTFSGTAGQQASVVTTNSTNPSCVNVAILKPDGTTLGSNLYCGASGFLDELTLPTTGTYTVLFDPSGAGTGSATLLLSIFNNVTGTITPGTQLNTTISYPGQDGRFTFSGTAGQQTSVVTTNSTNPSCVNMAILKPDGTTLGSNLYCGASGFLDELTLPTTGTYTVLFDPSGAGTGSATLLLSIFNDVTGTITIGTPLSTTTTYPGQDARYTFSGASGQSVSLQITNSTYSCLSFSILNPNGSTLASSFICSASGSISSHTLGTTGTYTVLIDPQGAGTGSATVALNSP